MLEALARLAPASFRPVEAFGLRFPNAVGLAAGFDKNARAWPAAAALGFGHVEIGTVTALAQPGNPRPRMFRYPQQEAVINRLGFNNEGSEAVAARLSRGRRPGGAAGFPLGINIGKSRVAGDRRAPRRTTWRASRRLADHADYVVLNVSSPNTPGLRQLQDEARLSELLRPRSRRTTARAASPGGRPRAAPAQDRAGPRIRPDRRRARGRADFGLDGLVATNTTLARPGAFARVSEAGGLSGAPLAAGATEVIRYVSRATAGRLPIIGVGRDHGRRAGAAEKLDAGARLVQVYTGMVYRGPFFAAELRAGAWRPPAPRRARGSDHPVLDVADQRPPSSGGA